MRSRIHETGGEENSNEPSFCKQIRPLSPIPPAEAIKSHPSMAVAFGSQIPSIRPPKKIVPSPLNQLEPATSKQAVARCGTPLPRLQRKAANPPTLSSPKRAGGRRESTGRQRALAGPIGDVFPALVLGVIGGPHVPGKPFGSPYPYPYTYSYTVVFSSRSPDDEVHGW